MIKKFNKVLSLALSLTMICATGLVANATETDLVAPVVPTTYNSELTGMPISSTLMTQRPVAIMVDNEKTALEHYGISEADIQYEMINSTKNGRITRSMYIFKDWAKIQRFGSIRSVRPTNLLIAPEYNAVVVHDGGPFYCDPYYAYNDHLSGGFKRYNNGKATEFTEYVSTGEISSRLVSAGISKDYKPGFDSTPHFKFGLADMTLGTSGTEVIFPFSHTKTTLKYNSLTRTYDHYLYGSIHKDAGNNQLVTYRNVIVMNVELAELDANGYMIYNILGSGTGYYLTDGKCIPITWQKDSDVSRTIYRSAATNEELTLNMGKTYIGICPTDSKVTIK